MNVSSSHGPALLGRDLLRRLLLLSASLAIGTVIWFLLGDSDGLVAEEKLMPAAHAATTPPSQVVAHVDGVAIFEEDVAIDVADELAEIEAARQRILEAALESRIEKQLIESEALSRGLSVEELLHLEVDAKLDQVGGASVQEGDPDGALDAVDAGPLAAEELRRQLRHQAFVTELREAAAISVHGEPVI